MSEAFPPPDFVPTTSTIAGIQVFKPAPPPADSRAVVDFTCPQCGASTAFGVQAQGLTCPYCGYQEATPLERVGRRAEEFEFKVETLAAATHGWGVRRQELVCQNCGARSTLSPESLTHTCAFCASNKVIQREASQDNLRPRFLIPFKITQKTCVHTARKWLGAHWMLPKQLSAWTSLVEFIPLYLSYWTFDAATPGIPCIDFWVDAAIFQDLRMNHPRSENLYPSGMLTNGTPFALTD